MKIMIVDDHAEMRRLLRQSLANVAAEFVECADGAEAVAAFSDQRPDWTIMDYRMEKMNGLEATRRIRQQAPEARVLIFSQHDNPALRTAAIEAGAAAFCSKDRVADVGTILKSQPPLQKHLNVTNQTKPNSL